MGSETGNNASTIEEQPGKEKSPDENYIFQNLKDRSKLKKAPKQIMFSEPEKMIKTGWKLSFRTS